MQPGTISDEALPRPSEEGVQGTVLCIECGYFGLGYLHPEWCTWEIMKKSGQRSTALAIIELGFGP
jgi:hypothetical protein